MSKQLNNNKNENEFFLRVWGARGSIPSPGKDTVKYGGNTSCLEVRCGKELFILDCGSGIRLLGNYLINQMPFNATIFLTHVHWDHIQGFPFFTPAYFKENYFKIYGSKKLNIQEIFEKQMLAPTFPVPIKAMQSKLEFFSINLKGKIKINNGLIIYDQLNHPNGCTSFRINYKNRSIVYATDTEHCNTLDENLLKLAKNTDILIYDTQYTPHEYNGETGPGKIGWGHSTWEEGVKIAKASNAKKLILWHHDPNHNDKIIYNIESETKKHFNNSYAAYEGMKIILI